MSIYDIIDAVINGPKYRQMYQRCSTNYAECSKNLKSIGTKLIAAENTIEQLKLLLPRPAPPELTNTIEKDTVWVQAVLADYKAKVIRLPLGAEFRLISKTDFMEFVAWDWVDQFDYNKFFRCGNFSISFKAHSDQFGINQVGIVLDYLSGHAYNIVIFPDKKVMILEPQSDQIWYWEDKDLPFYVLDGAVVII